MKFTRCCLLLFSLVSFCILSMVHAGENPHLSTEYDSKQSPCWFVNKSDLDPFVNVHRQKFFGKLAYKPSYDPIRTFSDFALLPMVFECGVRFLLGYNVPFSAIPVFGVSNVLNGIIHTVCSNFRFAAIIDKLTVDDYHLMDLEIREYLTHIQQFSGKFPSICNCGNALTTLVKENGANSDDFATEQDYQFVPITVPKKIKKNVREKTELRPSHYYYSALMTFFFTYFASALFYRSLTNSCTINTALRIELAIWWNWYLLYGENKKYQRELIGKVHELYEDFVINVHNSQIENQLTMEILKNPDAMKEIQKEILNSMRDGTLDIHVREAFYQVENISRFLLLENGMQKKYINADNLD